MHPRFASRVKQVGLLPLPPFFLTPLPVGRSAGNGMHTLKILCLLSGERTIDILNDNRASTLINAGDPNSCHLNHSLSTAYSNLSRRRNGEQERSPNGLSGANS